MHIASETADIMEYVPEGIESVETLQYLGLTHDATLEAFGVFAHKRKLEQYINTEFIEWAKRHVKRFPDYVEDDTVSE